METVFVTGAGFSANAGLPLASRFGRELLNIRRLEPDGPSALLASFLRCFVRDIFGHPISAPANLWPPLEDIFTFVDLSANTGHHLGCNWSAARLRTVRRALIARSMRMLLYSYNRKVRRPDAAFRAFNQFIEAVPLGRSAFLSMNWDAVTEQRFRTLRRIGTIDYGCDARAARFNIGRGGALRELDRPRDSTLAMFKPHGSFNWTYCDTCRTIFWVPPHQVPKVATQIFRESDWAVVESVTGETLPYETTPTTCPRCNSEGLGTRLATFSYRKALDFPMCAASWRAAEAALSEADNWVFIGYSLPAADYELKLLLKRVELARRSKPRMFLITMGSDAIVNYQQLFGRSAFPSSRIFEDGLNGLALNALRCAGVLEGRP